MKQLSIEEKAKAYDEAIERARLYKGLQAEMSVVFPELKKESEDERIRKEIISAVNIYCSEYSRGTKVREDMLAWLEKQGEHANFRNKIQIGDKVTRNRDGMLVNLSQLNRVAKKDENQEYQKPVDKVEPKFKVGDWIIDIQGVAPNKIIGYEDDSYLIKTSCSQFYLPMKLTEKNYRLWTIQDAKAGDVLADSLGNVCIYQEPSTKHMYHSYCYGNNKCFIDSGGSHNIVGTCPATKEQRDTLMKAMTDAGYTFDFEKKEFKKIEQKPADLRTKAGNWYICDMEVMNENMVTAFHRDEIYYCPKDGYLDVRGVLFEVGCLDVFRLATEKEIPQPKQEWSEEDEYCLDGAIETEMYMLEVVNGIKKFDVGNESIKEECTKELNWLKSLKYRVLPQPRQEWSERDELMLGKCIDAASGYYSPEDKQSMKDWLYFLKQRYTWKPSDEQMEQLGWIAKQNKDNMIGRELMTLYKDLKKLREE